MVTQFQGMCVVSVAQVQRLCLYYTSDLVYTTVYSFRCYELAKLLVQEARRYSKRLAHTIECDSFVGLEKLVVGCYSDFSNEVLFMHTQKLVVRDTFNDWDQTSEECRVVTFVKAEEKSFDFGHLGQLCSYITAPYNKLFELCSAKLYHSGKY